MMDSSSGMISLVMVLFAVNMASGIKELDVIMPQAMQEECREQSNFRDEIPAEGGHNVTQELKCFVACSLVKLGIMNDKDGSLNMAKLDELITTHTGGKDKADMFKATVVEPCIKEVKQSTDYCEYSFQLVSCGMNKIKPSSSG